MLMCLAISVPKFTASSAELVISTRIDGLSMSAISTLRPAASSILPSGAKISPEFSTRGATKSTSPPTAVRITPSFLTAPAFASPPVTAWASPNLSLPFKKSLFDKLKVDATKPATSTWEPAPNTTPLGLMMKTRPLDCNLPKNTDGSTPVTRFNTWLWALCCTNRSNSSRAFPSLFQSMMALGVLVTVKVLPVWLKSTVPPMTLGVPCTLPVMVCTACPGPAACTKAPCKLAMASAAARGFQRNAPKSRNTCCGKLAKNFHKRDNKRSNKLDGPRL